MTQHAPDRTDAARRTRLRAAMIFSGLADFAVAGFFLGWGHSVVGLEHRVAWILAAALAAFGVASLLIATFVFGRRGRGREGEDAHEPVVRR